MIINGEEWVRAHAEFTRPIPEDLLLHIDKVGGGTIGKRYVGDWLFVITNGAGTIVTHDIVTTGLPKTHSETADIVMEFLNTDME